jgi:3-mercaptopropionate dioxygenase
MKAQAIDTHPLIERLREAVRLGDTQAVTERIKNDLESFIPAEGLRLPEKFRRASPDCYCRRLFYRDPELGFTALVMTWGPGQSTPLHDHAGIWCVEGVLEGEMQVTRFDLEEQEEDGTCRFQEKGRVCARAGQAGALIPPFEYHVLANARPDQVSLTLHVYGGEMDHCSIFEPVGREGCYQKRFKTLSYDD